MFLRTNLGFHVLDDGREYPIASYSLKLFSQLQSGTHFNTRFGFQTITKFLLV